MIIKRSVPLPTFLPKVRSTGDTTEILAIPVGDSAFVSRSAASMRQMLKREVGKLADRNDIRAYMVWSAGTDGSAVETGGEFAIVARISLERADEILATGANPDVVIRGKRKEPVNA